MRQNVEIFYGPKSTIEDLGNNLFERADISMPSQCHFNGLVLKKLCRFDLKTKKNLCSSQVNLSTTTAGGTMTNPRPHGPATSATTTALNQSVLLGGNSAGQGQMYLRVSKKDHTYCQFF